jgi:Transposase DDE domain
MVGCESVCLRRAAGGERAKIVQFGRFLANEKVTLERLLDGWGERTCAAAAGRHVLAIQDTSEFCFRTTAERDRGLGVIGKGSGRGVLLHAMIAVDADDGACLGLVAGRVWTRHGRIEVPHRERALADKESARWVSTAERAREVLAPAAMVTVVGDSESDFFVLWARLPGPGFHQLGRAMQDRRLIGGGTLWRAPLTPGGTAKIELRERPDRPARTAELVMRFGRIRLPRPQHTVERDLPDSVELCLIEVLEQNVPPGSEPVEWRLLTTHAIDDAEAAWRAVGWYRARWTIEQLFRTLKQQGLQLEDSQVETADRLLKLTAIAAHAACITMQLVHARDGRSDQPASLVFTPAEIAALAALVPRLEGKTLLQKNPHPRYSLAWAAWAIGKLGGWDGYPRSKPPGPITFKHGLKRFYDIVAGCALRDV